ncbi:MAG TPA: ATP-binding protein [Elusimicrobiota bacterium]|nr:ATP-binding protein [Elusimicrobiota bacterium]
MRAWISARFHRKLALALGAALVLTMSAINCLVLSAARAHLTYERRRGLEIGAERAAARLAAPLFSPRARAGARAAAADISRDCACRAELLGPGGEVLADSGAPSPGPFLGPDQVRDAADDRPPYLRVERKSPGGGGSLRLTASESLISHYLRELREVTLGITFCALALALLLSLWLTRALSRPITEMSRTARRLARGDYGARVSPASADEIGEFGLTLNKLAETVQSHVDALSSEKSRLAAILENMVEAVIAVDGDGAVIAANPAMRALLDAPEERLLGASFRDALAEGPLSRLLERTLADGRARNEEISPARSSESTFEAHAAALPRAGRRAGALLVLHDVTRVRRLERVSKEFVANASHELRTPLASIAAFAEILSHDGPAGGERRLEFAGEISRGAADLTKLVDDLLDLSAIESGNRAPAPAPVRLAGVVEEAVAGLRRSAKTREISISVSIPRDLPPAFADREQLKRVLIILIDNAVKFNRPRGKVEIAAAAGAASIDVAVSDTGIGIPDEDVPRLFERFFRVDKARSRELGGTGLGLAIARRIIEAHGGSLRAESVLERGSTFRFTIPS